MHNATLRPPSASGCAEEECKAQRHLGPWRTPGQDSSPSAASSLKARREGLPSEHCWPLLSRPGKGPVSNVLAFPLGALTEAVLRDLASASARLKTASNEDLALCMLGCRWEMARVAWCNGRQAVGGVGRTHVRLGGSPTGFR